MTALTETETVLGGTFKEIPNKDWVEYKGCIFENVNSFDEDYRHVVFEECIFKNSTFNGGSFSFVEFYGCVFLDASFGTNFDYYSEFVDCSGDMTLTTVSGITKIFGSNLRKLTLLTFRGSNVYLENTQIDFLEVEDGQLDGSVWRNVNIKKAEITTEFLMRDVILSNVSIENLTAEKWRLFRSDLLWFTLVNATLKECELTELKMAACRFDGLHIRDSKVSVDMFSDSSFSGVNSLRTTWDGTNYQN